MKKLIITVAAVAIAAIAQAATVDWQYKITGATDSPSYLESNYTVYLVNASAWDGLSKITAETFTDSSVVLDSGAFATKTGKTATTRIYATAESAKQLNDSLVAKDATLGAYYVVVDSTANKYTVSSAVTLTGRAGDGSQITTGFGSTAQASLNWQDIGTGPTPVPEPTTGLLVLAGIAGLALRRRRA